MTSSCTCGPHPVVDVDLSSVESSSADDHSHAQPTQTQTQTCCSERVRDACRSHGCFHLRLSSVVPAHDGDRPSPLGNLRGGNLRSRIEALFDQDMTTRARLDPDGGLIETPYLASSSGRRSATYRGRTSESGAAEQPEPKQSWELRRCHGSDADIGTSTARVGGEERQTIVDERLEQAEEWTDGLHRVAEMVVELLGIDPNTVLKNGPCSCGDTAKPCGDYRCCIDLMRVFRYDALAQDESRASRPGSSAHTDWGAMTIVWQDTSGGLQTYCHECDKWSDVSASLGDAASDDAAVSVFVHVGDFLSLASGGQYPSPRHRVQRSKESRCSLVYFVYPPRAVSLQDVEMKLSPNGPQLSNDSIYFDRYSLLQNQSAHSSESIPHGDVYGHIRKVPFEDVIKEKWGQVQRK